MRKLTVIIADDDKLVLRDLRNMVDWEKLGFTIAATAASGEDAFALVDQYQPFLLITDIRMLGSMNGLDVIELAHKKYPRMKFLVISSYDDFHYLKRAMANGVIDYLLKTDITPTTLTQKLLDARNQFSRENQNNASIISPQLERFLEGERDQNGTTVLFPPEQFSELESLKNNRYYFMVCSRSHFFSRNPERQMIELRTQSVQMVQELYQHALNYDAFPIVCRYGQLMVVGLSGEMITSTFVLRDYSNSLLYLHGGTNPILQFYLDRTMTLEEFRSLIQERLPLVYYHLFFPPENNRPVNLDTLSKLCYVPVSEDFPFHALIFDQEHQEKDILLLKSYIETCCNACDIQALVHFFQNFCMHLELQTNSQLKLPEMLFAQTPEIFQKWIYNRLEDCILLLTRGVDHAFSPKVESAIRFMTQNYSDPDISSAEIAEASGLSVNRLGILIKQETGNTFNEYLAQIRIEKSIELLEKTNLKIYEISDRCGYKSSQYFSQVFYQKTGRKPIDYRRGRK